MSLNSLFTRIGIGSNWIDESIAQPLMIAFSMKMGRVLNQKQAQVSFTERYEKEKLEVEVHGWKTPADSTRFSCGGVFK